MIKVTIITPAYNGAYWLPETIDSILGQDYPNIEYLVFDDGSTDNTQEILGKYGRSRARWDPRLRVFQHPNMGEVRSINKGYQMAQGELVGVVSADDPLWTPTAITRMVEAANREPNALVFYPDFMLTNERGVVIQGIVTREWDYSYMVSHHHCTPGPGALMRRSVFDLVGYRNSAPNLRWVADLEYWLRVGRVGKMQRVPFFLATHRRHSEQLTLKMQGPEMARQHIYLYERFFQELANCCQREGIELCHHHDNLWSLKPQAMAYTYLTCAYVSPGDYVSMAKYVMMAIKNYPPIIREVGSLVLSKGVQLFLHRNAS